MGCSTFANFTVLPEIAVAKIREDAPFDKVCYVGCGVTTGIGAVINTAKVEPGAKCIVFGLGGIGLNVIQGLRLVGAGMIIGVDINNARKEWGERFGMTHFVNPKEIGGELVPYLVNLTKSGADQIGGADYTFECVGNVNLMRVALESCHRGWGESIIVGVAGAGQEIATRPFQLVTGRVWRGTAFGGARGRTDVPKIVDWYMDGKIEIDPMITHMMPLADINKGFDLMHVRRRNLLTSEQRECRAEPRRACASFQLRRKRVRARNGIQTNVGQIFAPSPCESRAQDLGLDSCQGFRGYASSCVCVAGAVCAVEFVCDRRLPHHP